ncbi:MAG: glycerophosphodiester phosphodiesterase family protein [Armatimonadota bacterium]|nr:glycerophosphodiester phosphodiesterase family protein [Armatimonadota bacterium]
MPPARLTYRNRQILLKYHRLLSGTHPHPPNSIPALTQVLADGADVIEFDVGRTGDGVFVLMHDDRLEGETTGFGPLRAITGAEFQRLRLRGTDVPPATLAEVVDVVAAVRRPVKVQVDLKEQEPMPPSVGERLVDALAPMRANPGVRVVVGCQADWNLRVLRRLDATLVLGLDVALHLDAPVDEMVRLPSRVNAYGYLDDHPLGFRRLWPVQAYLEDRFDVLLSLVEGVSEYYLRKELVAQALADGVNPIALIHERRPGALVDVWTFHAHEARAGDVLRAALGAGADQITSPTAALFPQSL